MCHGRDIIVSISNKAAKVTSIRYESTGNHAERAARCAARSADEMREIQLLDAVLSSNLP